MYSTNDAFQSYLRGVCKCNFWLTSYIQHYHLRFKKQLHVSSWLRKSDTCRVPILEHKYLYFIGFLNNKHYIFVPSLICTTVCRNANATDIFLFSTNQKKVNYNLKVLSCLVLGRKLSNSKVFMLDYDWMKEYTILLPNILDARMIGEWIVVILSSLQQLHRQTLGFYKLYFLNVLTCTYTLFKNHFY